MGYNLYCSQPPYCFGFPLQDKGVFQTNPLTVHLVKFRTSSLIVQDRHALDHLDTIFHSPLYSFVPSTTVGRKLLGVIFHPCSSFCKNNQFKMNPPQAQHHCFTVYMNLLRKVFRNNLNHVMYTSAMTQILCEGRSKLFPGRRSCALLWCGVTVSAGILMM